MTTRTAAGVLELTVFRYALASIAEEMHAALVHVARSTNIKDREDTSSAIYTVNGDVIAQSEQATPVHLGTNQATVRRILQETDLEKLGPGDSIVTNRPYPTGPGHLNDIAVISPVFAHGRMVAIVANQAHHVDVGGYAPGSMPFGVSEIFQEGLQIPAVTGFREYQLDATFWAMLSANIRDPQEVRGDLEAQFAANCLGADRVRSLIDRMGLSAYVASCDDFLNYGERMMRAVITGMPDGSYSFEDYIEGDGIDDAPIWLRVAVTVEADKISFDFTATDPMSQGPLNCRLASVAACVYYVMMALSGPEVPSNAGSYRPIEIFVKEGTLLQSTYPAAVCNANIVTTQRIVDVILGALASALPERIGAASSGSMNLVNIGINSEAGYQTLVETYGGGQGGKFGQDGMDAVQTHMTNTRNAPIEIIESIYPIMVEYHGLCPDTEGAGKWRGGTGMRRRYLLKGPATVTLASDRRSRGPWGLFGGHDGSPGSAQIVRAHGEVRAVPSKATFTLNRGDRFELTTPGGGGYGDPAERDRQATVRDVRDSIVSRQRAIEVYGVAAERLGDPASA